MGESQPKKWQKDALKANHADNFAESREVTQMSRGVTQMSREIPWMYSNFGYIHRNVLKIWIHSQNLSRQSHARSRGVSHMFHIKNVCNYSGPGETETLQHRTDDQNRVDGGVTKESESLELEQLLYRYTIGMTLQDSPWFPLLSILGCFLQKAHTRRKKSDANAAVHWWSQATVCVKVFKKVLDSLLALPMLFFSMDVAEWLIGTLYAMFEACTERQSGIKMIW